MLRITNLTKRFGGVTAVNGINLQVSQGSILGLIGPNGAGKTTLLNLIIGIYSSDSGEIYFKDEQISGLSPHQIVAKGIGKTYQRLRVFPRLSVLDNLIIGGLCKFDSKEKLREKASRLLDMFSLNELRDEYAGNLSGGQTKLLDLSRALIADPSLVLMDEPFHGIHPSLKEEICDKVKKLNEEKGISFMIVSHDIPSIMSVCKRIVALNSGVMIADGSPEAVRGNKGVIEAYLGR